MFSFPVVECEADSVNTQSTLESQIVPLAVTAALACIVILVVIGYLVSIKLHKNKEYNALS